MDEGFNRRAMPHSPGHGRKEGRWFSPRATIKPWCGPQGQRLRKAGRNQTVSSNRQFRTGRAVVAGQSIVFPKAVCYIGEVENKLDFVRGGKPRHLIGIKLQRRAQSSQSVGFVSFRGGGAAPGPSGRVGVHPRGRNIRLIAPPSDGKARPLPPHHQVQSDALFGISNRLDPLPDLNGFFDPNPARANPQGSPFPWFPFPAGARDKFNRCPPTK